MALMGASCETPVEDGYPVLAQSLYCLAVLPSGSGDSSGGSSRDSWLTVFVSVAMAHISLGSVRLNSG